MTEGTLQIRWLHGLTKHIPPAQVVRYLVVGACNTVFGFLSYAALTALFAPLIPHSYILANVLASLLNITVSFLGYKRFVFKTQGNYLREWFRCVIVYSGGIIVGTLALPILVFALRHATAFNASAPYIAGAILMAVNVILSFLGHKKFSFARNAAESSS